MHARSRVHTYVHTHACIHNGRMYEAPDIRPWMYLQQPCRTWVFIHVSTYSNGMHTVADVERSGRVVKVAGCESTDREFESTLTPLVAYVRALNKFSLKSKYVPVHLAV